MNIIRTFLLKDVFTKWKPFSMFIHWIVILFPILQSSITIFVAEWHGFCEQARCWSCRGKFVIELLCCACENSLDEDKEKYFVVKALWLFE